MDITEGLRLLAMPEYKNACLSSSYTDFKIALRNKEIYSLTHGACGSGFKLDYRKLTASDWEITTMSDAEIEILEHHSMKFPPKAV